MAEPETGQQSTKAGAAKKSKPPPPPPPSPPIPADELTARVEVVRTSLLNAQHWLDSGIALLNKDARANVSAKAQMASRFLKEAAVTIDEVGQPLRTPELVRQADATSRAMADFQELVFAAPVFNERADDIAADDIRVRVLLGLPDVKRAPHKPAIKQNDVYEAQALGPVLDLVRIEATQAFMQLRPLEHDKTASKDEREQRTRYDEKREQIVVSVSATLRQHLGHALELIVLHTGDESRTFGPKVEAATVAALKIDRWIRGRQTNSSMRSAFAPVIEQARQIRAEVLLPALEHVETPRMTRSIELEEETDKGTFEQAQENLETARDSFFFEFLGGVDRFRAFKELKRPEPDASILEELGKGLLVSVVGNLAGAAIGSLLVNAFEGSATDTVEAVAGKAADGAFAKVKNENATKRHFQFFLEGLEKSQSELAAKTKKALAQRYLDKDITQTEIEEKTAAIEQQLATVRNKTYQGAAHAYASLLSREGLGIERHGPSKGSPKVGSSKEYFGEVPDTLEGRLHDATVGAPRPRVGGKAGTTGVAKLTVSYDGSPRISGFEVYGMNGDMAKAVLERAEYDLRKLGLVLEIHLVQPVMTVGGPAGPVAVAQRRPKIVVDERGTVRGSADWDALSPLMQVDAILRSPETAWQWIQQQTVTKKVVDE